MNFSDIQDLADDDMRAVNTLIISQLNSDVSLINQIGHYIINSGGKRLRPLLVVLASRALAHNDNQHITIAAIIEFIHTATLLHDDVVDDSHRRRNKDTANHVWGNAASVLVGDYLYSRAFEMMVELQNMHIMSILSHATNRIAEGEVLQLLNCNNPDLGEQDYIDVIVRKTATLFAAGTQLAAVICNSDKQTEDNMKAYGLNLGIAFQIIDDVLDYQGQDSGKDLGDDLEEGKLTLPLIRTLAVADEHCVSDVYNAIKTGGRDNLDNVMAAIKSCDALDYSIAKAQDYIGNAKSALTSLPDSNYKDALEHLADFTIQRLS